MGVGPSTKETTLHHFRDPLVAVFGDDPDIDFQGVIVVGTPQDNLLKNLVGKRVAKWLQAMRTDGAVISADGWGNSDVDFMNTMSEIGHVGISVVGLKFIGTQATFVVTNEYTPFVLDINKSKAGIETTVVGENNLDLRDANKALGFLKLKMRSDLKTK
ncbi:proline reductase [Loigolactobacillus backii]|uniref:Proline reductase n=1 Tax=Loigolactobacillus backii TaxID=375175 RepID=A0A192H158_9LACO|nr:MULTISPECIES: glycine/sarcosine/betaine reductase component B subunit [Loigolactobacillus]ANK61977.1 proline reductase [Loigolactobacillus backii]ANK65407.1 proline reductase [Loigolactobacillus backii]ANK68829.1 proline reductase [Loigolactobacillus backii]